MLTMFDVNGQLFLFTVSVWIVFRGFELSLFAAQPCSLFVTLMFFSASSPDFIFVRSRIPIVSRAQNIDPHAPSHGYYLVLY